MPRSIGKLYPFALAPFMVGACDQSDGSGASDRSIPVVRESAATDVARYAVEVDPDYGAKAEVADWAVSTPVRRTAAIDAVLYAHARKCWPPTRDTELPTGEAQIQQELQRNFGHPLASMPCTIVEPANLPRMGRYVDFGTASPLGLFAESLPLFQKLSAAYRQHEVPIAQPPPIMRRRWRSEVRIKPPADAVMRDALAKVIDNDAFRRAMADVPIVLTDHRPNAALISDKQILGCPPNSLGACPTTTLNVSGRHVDRYRLVRDALAQRLTDGRRNWFDDGSDFADARPIEVNVSGFTVGGTDRIEGAVCTFHGDIVNRAWRRDFPHAGAAQPAHRQHIALSCLLRILGISGMAREVTPSALSKVGRAELIALRGPVEDQTIVFGRAAFHALDQVYKR